MTFRHNRKIDRSYDKPFFNRRRNTGRIYGILFLLMLIFTVPAAIFWQADTITMTAMEQLGVAPTPTPFAGERAIVAEDFYAQGDIETAAFHYSLAVAQQPQNITYKYEYGLILIELDRNQEALALGEEIIDLAPNDPRGYALKAQSIAWTNPTVAIPAAVEGREVDNNFAPLWASLAVSYTSISRFTEALRAGDFAVALDPLDPVARRSYSLPLIYTGNYSEAIRQLEQAIAINPNLVGPYFELALLYRNPQINQPEVAISIYFEILEIEPDNERAYLRLCETNAAAGLFQEAEGFCNTALDLDPAFASAHRMRGQLRYSRRNYEGAIESFQMCYLLYAEEQLGIDIVDPVEVETQPNIDITSIEEQVDPNTLDLAGLEIECIYVRGLAHYFLGGPNCDLAWQWLNYALNHPGAQASVQENILLGLTNVTIRCPGYVGQALPTPIPPTPIPPTPIGG